MAATIYNGEKALKSEKEEQPIEQDFLVEPSYWWQQQREMCIDN